MVGRSGQLAQMDPVDRRCLPHSAVNVRLCCISAIGAPLTDPTSCPTGGWLRGNWLATRHSRLCGIIGARLPICGRSEFSRVGCRDWSGSTSRRPYAPRLGDCRVPDRDRHMVSRVRRSGCEWSKPHSRWARLLLGPAGRSAGSQVGGTSGHCALHRPHWIQVHVEMVLPRGLTGG